LLLKGKKLKKFRLSNGKQKKLIFKFSNQEKLSQFEKELSHSAEEWKKSQMVTLQRIEQLKESIKVSGNLERM
jgi:hypothetical protein